ncbi:biotin-dependent carboxyltransferase family protein [Pseudonocardia sp. RS11V-5]|uniref:5-oxoprolinase subunit C family protein n=1 Tax=Pseudonocardia terrae TaxID=2905831 RepID=UPI001E53849E|nr:biotin-dependent carboxyltransferase family protein [Pseudonocardia terrae]MCE3552578.1 biotin-dependent carboxyltransferase family protein [Pseudonocardia terrae]
MIEVLDPGPQALVQDLGRPGLAAIGVGRSGAADRASLCLGNRLLANDEGAAGVEILLGGFAARAHTDLLVALTGAPAPATVDGRPVGHQAHVRLRRGQELRLGPPPAGLRTYLCVRGGIAVPPVLGARSTDVLSGIGPEPLEKGAELPIGPEPEAYPVIDYAPVAPPAAGLVTLRAISGPHAEHAVDPGALATSRWVASGRTDRVGMRLEGAALEVAEGAGSLPSEGLTRGAIQLPPGGEPVVFLADHPVTGGYPVIAVLRDADVDRAAQIRPGQPVRITLSRENTWRT